MCAHTTFRSETPWVWNPVQVGCWQNYISKLLEFSRASHRKATAVVNPMNWGGCKLITTVNMTQTVLLHKDHIRMQMAMLYTGKSAHQPTYQELPALFLTRRFNRLWFYNSTVRAQATQ